MAYPQVYSSETGQWTNLFEDAISIDTIGGVDINNPQEDELLRYDSASSNFVNESISAIINGKNIAPATINTSGLSTFNSASVINNANVNGNLVVGSTLTVNGVLITGSSPSATVTTEQIQDAAAPLFDHAFHTNITATYDDANNRILLSASASSASVTVTTEEIQDAAAPLLNHAFHNNITATYDDANNRIVLSASASSGSVNVSTEDVQDIVGPMFAHSNHTNASATYNDSTGQILISVATPINGSNQTNFYDVVRDYGAVAGEANSATKIQNALNAARDAGTGIVYIPAGTYNVQSTLQIFSGTTLYLTPKTVIFRQFPTSPLLANGAYNASYSGYSGQSNIRIVGGIWESRGAAYPIEPAMGISIGHATDVVIQDLTISNIGGYHAIEINSSKNVKIENCRFTGFKDTGNRGYSEAVQIDYAGEGLFGWFGAYDGTHCKDIVVDKCYFGPSGTAGTTSWPSGIGSHSYLAGSYHKDVKFINNTFEDISEYAIRSFCVYDNLLISKNIIRNCYGGIAVGLDGNRNHSSTISNTTMLGYAPQVSYNTIISDNIIDNSGTSGASGIWVINAENVNIVNNVIKGITRQSDYIADGILGVKIINGNISNNVLQNIANDGIDLRKNSRNVMISNNTTMNVSLTTNNTFRHIYLNDDADDCSIISNRGYRTAANIAAHGMEFTSTTNNLRIFGNQYGTSATTPIANNSVGSNTTVTNT